MALDCSVMEKKPLVKDVLPNPLGKEHPGSARKILPHLNLCTWRNLLVRILGQFVGSLLGRSFASGLGLKPTFGFKGFCLRRVMTKPKSKEQTEVTGPGLPSDPKASNEFSWSFGSSSSLQWQEVSVAVAQGGGMTTSTSSEMFEGTEDTPAKTLFFPPEGASSSLISVFAYF